MAAPSAQTLQRLADDTGHQPGTLEKVLRLLDLLQEIARDRVLSDRLVLKGGTALNLFHLGLERLSVDIDLNYVGALDRAAMEAERPAVDAALDRLLASQGYGVRRRPDEHAGGKWLARYASALRGNATLEVDVNYHGAPAAVRYGAHGIASPGRHAGKRRSCPRPTRNCRR